MNLDSDDRAIHEGAAIGAIAPRTQLAVAGTERASYLQGLLTNDIPSLAPGTGCYAAWLSPQGRMLTDMHVLESGGMILLDVPSESAASTLARLEQFLFTEDVRLGSLADALTGVWLHGPQAAATLERLLQGGPEGPPLQESLIGGPEGPPLLQASLTGGHQGPPLQTSLEARPAAFAPFAPRRSREDPILESSTLGLSDWPDYHHRQFELEGEPVSVARIDQLGVPGYCVYLDRSRQPRFMAALQGAGAVPVGADAIEAARIEAGYPVFGVDMTEATIPLEAGIEHRAISFTKGCYVGQEIIIRVLHRGGGRVAKKLVALRIAAGRPDKGAKVFAGEREIGEVTSAAESPRFGPIALAYVHRDFVAPGTAVDVDTPTGRSPAIVSDRPMTRGPEA